MTLPNRLKTQFNDVYEAYDRWRPTYVPELYRDIFAYHSIGALSRVLEVGIGTGQATQPILQTGCALTAVELGDKLAAYCEQKFIGYENFSIVNLPFEQLECESASLDMVYSASAFHWIPEAVGYPRVFDLLKSGGAFARFANHPHHRKGDERIFEAIQSVYAKYMPRTAPGPACGIDQARQRSNISEKYGFIDQKVALYRRDRTFCAQDYVALIGTYSDHSSLPPEQKKGLFDGVYSAINDFGGTFTLTDTIDLQLARKP